VLLYVLFVCKCAQPPGDNPIAVNKYHLTSYLSGKEGVSRLIFGAARWSVLMRYCW